MVWIRTKNAWKLSLSNNSSTNVVSWLYTTKFLSVQPLGYYNTSCSQFVCLFVLAVGIMSVVQPYLHSHAFWQLSLVLPRLDSPRAQCFNVLILPVTLIQTEFGFFSTVQHQVQLQAVFCFISQVEFDQVKFLLDIQSHWNYVSLSLLWCTHHRRCTHDTRNICKLKCMEVDMSVCGSWTVRPFTFDVVSSSCQQHLKCTK